MELYGHYSKSIPQKITIHVLELIFLALSYWILFDYGEQSLSIHTPIDYSERKVILFVFNIVVFLRLAYMMFFLLKRKIPWEESISVPKENSIHKDSLTILVISTISVIYSG